MVTNKKKIDISVDEGRRIHVKDLKEKACEIFDLVGVGTKLWDRGFDDWCDPDSDEDEVENNTKILVKDAEARSTAELIPVSKCFTQEAEPLTHLQASPQGLSTSVSWMVHYTLPDFPSGIAHKLDKGELLREGQRSAILEMMYSSVKTHTYYPTSNQYNHLIGLLFQRFPKLGHQPDMSLQNARTLWKYRLQYKFANSRKRDDHQVQIVAQRKRKSGDKPPSDSSTAKKAPPQWGIANYQPSRPSSEDDSSIQAHIQWMQQEVSKRKPNSERIQIAMSMTLSDRRRLITVEGASVLKIKQTYPWLFDEDEMYQEFRRLTDGKEGPLELLTDGLQKYADGIIRNYRSIKKSKPIVQHALEAVALHREEKSRREATCVAAALAIPSLLKEQVEDLVIIGEDMKNYPFIQGNNDMDIMKSDAFDVVVDGIAVSSSSSLLAAFSVCFASYYVLNLAYPSCLKKTCVFFQKVLLNIQDNLKPERSVVSLLEKLIN